VSILIDDREDPGLTDHLARFGLPISTVRLEYGDLAIQSSEGLLIGYERKRLTDLIACMQDRRLSGHQLKGMWGLYDRVELIVEGIWKPGDTDAIEIMNGHGGWTTLFHRGSGISYRQVDSYLYSQYECGGVPCWRTGSLAETAHLYASRFHWWQKDYQLHKSHDVLFCNEPSAQRRGACTLHQGAANAVTMMAAQVPGIDSKAWDIGKHFRSPADMCLADEREWRRVEWTDRKGNVKHFGKETARRIVDWLRGRPV
jgi:ERCC4-type nuclease